MNKIKFILLLSIIFFSACEADSPAEVVEEKETLELTNLEVRETGGVQLEATYTGSSKLGVYEKGFLISRYGIPSEHNSQKITGTITGSRMLGESESGFIYNAEYQVRAYVKFSEDKILFSETESFVSLGSRAPEVTGMNRSLIMDTVTISGKYFSENQQYTKVYFGNASGRVIFSNDTLIKSIVPETIESHHPPVAVEVYGKKVYYNDFSLLPPSIEKVSQNSLAMGDTLTVYGQNFDFDNRRNKVLLDNKEAEILSSSRESIRFVIPEGLTKSTLDLKLQTQLQEAFLPEALTIKKPEITGFPSGPRAFETIEITGQNFSSIKDDIRIFFDNLPAEVLEASRTKIKVQIPIGPYEDKNVEVRIELMDYNVVYQGEFILSDKWLLKSSINSGSVFRGHKHFIHNNKAYLFEPDNEYTRWKVHVMDPTTDTWSSSYVSYPKPDVKNHDYTIILNEESGRIFFHFSVDSHDFYEFFPVTESFIEREDFPGVKRGLPAAFSINDRLYMGLGRFMESGYQDRDPISHFWSYDVNLDQWEQIASFPQYGERSDLSVFVIDGEAYLGNGASTTGDEDFWKYSPATNTWKRLADFPGARTWTSYFEYGGKAYVYYGGGLTGDPDQVAFEYNPATNTWNIIDPVNEFYYTYFIYPEGTYALRFENAVYLGITMYPKIEFFKADLDRL